jgi:hypothetical protein
MNIKVIKTTSHMNIIRELFRNITNMLTKEEVHQRILSDNIRELYHLIEQYRTPAFRSETMLAHVINLIAQVDMRKAESLIEQIKSLCFIGLFGLRISDKHLEFRHICKLYIYSCDVEYLTIYTSIFSDFAVDIEIKNSIINTLVIYFNVLCMTEKPQIERQVLEYLKKNKVTVDNLQIKFS